MNKIDYSKKADLIIDSIKNLNNKPTILLHACCGPCSTYPLEYLTKYFKVTIFFNNSNIYPGEEYERRLEELKKFLLIFEQDYHEHVDLIIRPYENEKYMQDLEEFKDQKEGSIRCFKCYEKRMSEAYDFANKNGYDFFTTVMTISRQKDSQILNQIGEKLSNIYTKTRYFYSDFKKRAGIDRGRELRIKYNLYQQLYCGCKYSFNEYLNKENLTKK